MLNPHVELDLVAVAVVTEGGQQLSLLHLALHRVAITSFFAQPKLQTSDTLELKEVIF